MLLDAFCNFNLLIKILFTLCIVVRSDEIRLGMTYTNQLRLFFSRVCYKILVSFHVVTNCRCMLCSDLDIKRAASSMGCSLSFANTLSTQYKGMSVWLEILVYDTKSLIWKLGTESSNFYLLGETRLKLGCHILHD